MRMEGQNGSQKRGSYERQTTQNNSSSSLAKKIASRISNHLKKQICAISLFDAKAAI